MGVPNEVSKTLEERLSGCYITAGNITTGSRDLDQMLEKRVAGIELRIKDQNEKCELLSDRIVSCFEQLTMEEEERSRQIELLRSDIRSSASAPPEEKSKFIQQ